MKKEAKNSLKVVEEFPVFGFNEDVEMFSCLWKSFTKIKLKFEPLNKLKKNRRRNDFTNVEDKTWMLQSGGGRWLLGPRVQLWIPGELRKFFVCPCQGLFGELMKFVVSSWWGQGICCFSLVSSGNLLFVLGERQSFCSSLCFYLLASSKIFLLYLSEL